MKLDDYPNLYRANRIARAFLAESHCLRFLARVTRSLVLELVVSDR